MERPGRLEDMVVFARVVELGSLTRAARKLGSTRSAVSKALARLEERLGARLLHRTTRELSPTAAGRACYAHCARIAAEAEAAERAASDLRDAPHGALRVSCAASLGVMLAPTLPAFAARYPNIALEFGLTEAVVDLVRQGIDLGIRLGKMPDSTLVARKLVSYRRVVVASPRYLAAHPAPRTPADLAKHHCLLRIGHDDWSFGSGKRAVAVRVHGNYRADSPEVLRQAALAGLGVTLLPSFMVGADLAAGRLVALLEPHASEHAAIYVVYPHARHLAPSVRAFVDFLLEVVTAMESA